MREILKQADIHVTNFKSNSPPEMPRSKQIRQETDSQTSVLFVLLHPPSSYTGNRTLHCVLVIYDQTFKMENTYVILYYFYI